jgi:hypothetical protein
MRCRGADSPKAGGDVQMMMIMMMMHGQTDGRGETGGRRGGGGGANQLRMVAKISTVPFSLFGSLCAPTAGRPTVYSGGMDHIFFGKQQVPNNDGALRLFWIRDR